MSKEKRSWTNTFLNLDCLSSLPGVHSPSPALRAKAIAIVGTSNTGKTELICRLLEWFSAPGLRVAVLKHSHHQHWGMRAKTPGATVRPGGGW